MNPIKRVLWRLQFKKVKFVKHGWVEGRCVKCEAGHSTNECSIYGCPCKLDEQLKRVRTFKCLYKTKDIFRPKTRGELIEKLKQGIKCEVVASNEEITSIALDGWLNFQGKYKTYPSRNVGWVIYELL